MSEPGLHPVACGSCRAKKCRCDRLLPSCSQCNKTGSSCSYPRSFKRGFPEGYLAGLEQRLVDTELALFDTLSVVFGIQTSVAALQRLRHQAAAQSKAERTEEWARFPLNNSGIEARRLWLIEKCRFASIELESQKMTSTYRTPGEGPVSPAFDTSWLQSQLGPTPMGLSIRYDAMPGLTHSSVDRHSRQIHEQASSHELTGPQYSQGGAEDRSPTPLPVESWQQFNSEIGERTLASETQSLSPDSSQSSKAHILASRESRKFF